MWLALGKAYVPLIFHIISALGPIGASVFILLTPIKSTVAHRSPTPRNGEFRRIAV